MTSTEKTFYQDLTETVSDCNYKWTLHNFLSFTDACIQSPIFSNCATNSKSNLNWLLELYPDGQSKDQKGFVDIFLYSMNDFNISIVWEFTMSCNNNTKVYRTMKENHAFKYREGSGYSRYLLREILLDDLKSSENDTLTVDFKISFTYDKAQPINIQTNLIKNLKALLEMEESSDVTLISKDGKEHRAHKAMLVCRSKVFSAMFRYNMQESKDNIVIIEDVDEKTLAAMLYFIYTGKVKNLRDNVKKLFIVADKYELNDLRELCVYYLCENIKNDNILELIEFCHLYSIDELEKKTKDYFLKNHKDIIATIGRENMKNLSRFIIEELLYNLAVNNDENRIESESSNSS